MREKYAQIQEMKEFYEQYVSFAFAHSAEELCVSLRSGTIWYLDISEYRKGAIEMSPSFHEFVLRHWINAEQGAVDC